MRDFILIENLSSIAYTDFRNEVAQSSTLAIDTETTGLDPFLDKVTLIQVATKDNIYLFNTVKLNKENFKEIVSVIAESDSVKIFHNAKFDLKFLFMSSGIVLENIYDTQVSEQLLRAGYRRNYYPSLSQLVLQYEDIILDKLVRDEFIGSTVITQEMLIYSALDVKFLNSIRNQQLSQVTALGLDKVLELELELLPVVSKMELAGVTLDVEAWTKLFDKAVKKKDEVADNITKKIVDFYLENHNPESLLEAVEDLALTRKNTIKQNKFFEETTSRVFVKKYIIDEFNISSIKQITSACQMYGLPIDNVQEATLLEIKDMSSLVEVLLEYKFYDKRVSTYGEKYLRHINPVTNKIHANAHQLGTVTGRFSYGDPNLQQVPTDIEIIEEKERAVYRNCVVATPGYLLLTADYSQAEMRLAGAISGERGIIDAYKQGLDIHTSTAADIFNVAYDKVTSKQRSRAKTVNFAILYGTTAYGLHSNNPDISFDEAKDLMSRFFASRPDLVNFIQIRGKQAQEEYMSATVLGRIRFFKEENPLDAKFTKKGEEWKYKSYLNSIKREGVNHAIQGTSADALKRAMVNLDKHNPFGDRNFRILFQIHDELVVEVKENIVEEAKVFLGGMMAEAEQQFLGEEIPAEVDIQVSRVWEK